MLCASALELSDLIFMGRILAFVMCIKGHAGQWEESSIGGEVERFQNRSFHGTLAAWQHDDYQGAYASFNEKSLCLFDQNDHQASVLVALIHP